jgi:hypothetical protein
VQEALDTRETHAVDSGGGAFAVGGDQVVGVALIEGAVQALRTLRARSGAHTGLARAAV